MDDSPARDQRLKAFINGLEHAFPGFFFLDVPVNPVLNKNTLKGSGMPLLLQFAQTDFKFGFKEVNSVIGGSLQDVAHPHE
mgnify:CR=1 FL=1